MSLDQSIKHGHDHRKQYYGAKAIDKSCRNHGSDDWALGDRMHKHAKREQAMKDRERDKEWTNEDYSGT